MGMSKYEQLSSQESEEGKYGLSEVLPTWMVATSDPFSTTFFRPCQDSLLQAACSFAQEFGPRYFSSREKGKQGLMVLLDIPFAEQWRFLGASYFAD